MANGGNLDGLGDCEVISNDRLPAGREPDIRRVSGSHRGAIQRRIAGVDRFQHNQRLHGGEQSDHAARNGKLLLDREPGRQRKL